MPKKRGWFNTEGRLGDRDLYQQIMGLEQLYAEVAGKTVYDAGCAEGLISMELARLGAAHCYGVEIVSGHIEVANRLKGDLPCEFEVVNLNERVPHREVDIVIALAVLHKLKDPSAGCRALAACAKETMVIRLPPYGTRIVDTRSENVPHDIHEVMTSCGFRLALRATGPFDEWMGYYRRV